MYPIVIASYPRSGSTWLRFILCNILYPDIEHNFDTVNKHIPPIDHPPGLLAGIDNPKFYKTHGLTTATNILFLHRHVGDVLESEWWYKKKMYGEPRTIHEYLEATDYGVEWRAHVDHYFPATFNVSYGEINNLNTYRPFCFDDTNIAACILHADLEKMQKIEEQGFGDYPHGDLGIKFCRSGVTGQWREWQSDMKDKLLGKNEVQLKKLGYAKLP